MDVHLYRQREQAERAFASQARDEATRKTHLDLAESYRAVIVAYERLEELRAPGSSRLTGRGCAFAPPSPHLTLQFFPR